MTDTILFKRCKECGQPTGSPCELCDDCSREKFNSACFWAGLAVWMMLLWWMI